MIAFSTNTNESVVVYEVRHAYYLSAYTATACTRYQRESDEYLAEMRRHWLLFTRGNGWTTESRLRARAGVRSLLRQRVTPCARVARRAPGVRVWRSMKTIRRQERKAMAS